MLFAELPSKTHSPSEILTLTTTSDRQVYNYRLKLCAPRLPQSPRHGGLPLESLPPGQGGEQGALGLPLQGADLLALQHQLHNISGHFQALPGDTEDQSEQDDPEQELSPKNTLEPGYADPMAAALKARVDIAQNDILIKTTTVRTFLAKGS